MSLKVEDFKNNEPIGEYVYNNIKKNIINLNIKPGDRISEKEVSEIFNVSRTPVREAFIKLSKEGLLYVVPQKGTYISYIDLETVEEARFMRESLETSVMKLAVIDFPKEYIKKLEDNLCQQIKCIKKKEYDNFLELDELFHKTIFKGCNKERTWQLIEQINTQYKRIRLLTFIADINWQNVINQHQEIINAIKEKDENKIEKIISEHLKKLLVEQIEVKKQFPEYFK